MEQYEVNDLYQLALDVQLQDHKVGKALLHLVRHLAATEGLEPDQLKEAPPEKQTPATDVDMDIAPLGEDHSQVPTHHVPYPSREAPRNLSGEPIDRLERDQEAEEEHRRGRSRKQHKDEALPPPDEPGDRPVDLGLRGPVEGE